MNTVFSSHWFGIAFAALAAGLLFGCQSPVDKLDPASDPIEFESVWQYLKAYSIHADDPLLNHKNSVPQDPFGFSSPTALMDSVHDTLKASTNGSYSYTCYYGGSGINGTEAAAASSGSGQAVFFDSLDASTACLTITTFESSTCWNDFKVAIAQAQNFPNIVVDIRENHGGSLDVLDSIVSVLVPAGTPYIEASDREYDQTTKSYITADWHPWISKTSLIPEFSAIKRKYVVIMDSMSASASEVFASAMYEGDTTTKLIGMRSYGKGMGQIILNRRTRPSLQITFLYIKGVSSRIGLYHRIGIPPDAVPLNIQRLFQIDDPWAADFFYAAKMLDASVTPSSMNYPQHQAYMKQTAKTTSGCYKVINVDDFIK
jgi:hypothetical protein